MRLTISLLARKIGKWSKKYSNLPDSYIERTMRQIYWKTPRGKPQYLPRTIERKKFYFSVERPWTNEFYMRNTPRKYVPDIHVEPIKEWSFFRGDRVEILIGRDKGKQGIVKDIIEERNWVIVEGLNTKLRHVGKSKTFPGMYIAEEQPLLVTTDIALVDPATLQPTQIEWRYTEEGEKVRISVVTGRIIPIPISAEETVDYTLPSLYKEQQKDTTKEEVQKVTFEPTLKTFEMDIMEKLGIEEDRIPKKTYWY